jgi:hypothetical protein
MSKKVKTKWVVAVPAGAKIKVSVGEEVPVDSDLLEVEERGEKIINISEKIENLGLTDKKKLMEKLTGLTINENEVVFETGGIFPKKITLPVNGEVIKIDEFENLHFKEADSKIRKISCPVRAKVVKIDDQSLEMEFRAIEYIGREINEGRAWATEGIKYMNDIADLSSKDKNKIILMEKFNSAWMFKAEAVGIKGVVIVDSGEEEKDDRINLKLPILALEKDEWEELKKQGSEVKKAMINSSAGRLLLVI